MTDKEFFNFDDILADFSSYSDKLIKTEQDSAEKEEAVPPVKEAKPEKENFQAPAARPVYKPQPASRAVPEKEPDSMPEFSFQFTDSDSQMGDMDTVTPVPAEKNVVFNFDDPVPTRSSSARPRSFKEPSPVYTSAAKAPERPAMPQKSRSAKAPEFDPELMGMNSAEATRRRPAVKREVPHEAPRSDKRSSRRTAAAENTELSRRPEKISRAPKAEKPVKSGSPAGSPSPVSRILALVFAFISLFSLAWVFVNVHPDSGIAVGGALKSKVNMVEKFDSYANNAASDALGDLAYIPKIYTIAEDMNVAPKPNPAKFGSTTDPNEVMKVIASASALIGDQEMVFNPNLNFIEGNEIKYYCDDTILAIAWKEDNNGKCCTCSEVKIAHGSQIRRKVAGDTYSVGKRYYATDMAKECNAVVAINGDFYDFRPIGVTVFQRELFRFEPGKLDSCHITSNGDFLFSYAGELVDEEYTRQYIKDNDVIFSLSFGPILIDNGELRHIDGYPIGEVNTTYSRSAIGLVDNLHYMLMTVNYDYGYRTAATLNEIGEFMFSKNCQKAYALDGGQTSVLMMNGELVNHVDYGNERTMSDIVYFATAIPEEEAAK